MNNNQLINSINRNVNAGIFAIPSVIALSKDKKLIMCLRLQYKKYKKIEAELKKLNQNLEPFSFCNRAKFLFMIYGSYLTCDKSVNMIKMMMIGCLSGMIKIKSLMKQNAEADEQLKNTAMEMFEMLSDNIGELFEFI